jgi:hypothetical protein
MELTDLPVEIIYEIADHLDVDTTRNFEIALDIKFPDYLVNVKYKKIFDKSIDKISKIIYYITSVFPFATSHRRSEGYEVIYTHRCDCTGRYSLSINREGEQYAWPYTTDKPRETNSIAGVQRYVDIISDIDVSGLPKYYNQYHIGRAELKL